MTAKDKAIDLLMGVSVMAKDAAEGLRHGHARRDDVRHAVWQMEAWLDEFMSLVEMRNQS